MAELLQERYGVVVALEPADSELKRDPASDELTICPTLYWCERGAHFVVYKVAPGRYRCQFFYADSDQYGTGHDDYVDLRRCCASRPIMPARVRASQAGPRRLTWHAGPMTTSITVRW